MTEERLDPYNVLGIKRSANVKEAEAAYKKLALKYHPDRKNGDREMYDKIFVAYNEIKKNPEIKYIKVKEVEMEYKNSEEERNEIIKYYNKYKGKVSKIIDNLVFSSDADEERIRKIITDLLKEEKLKKYKNFEIKLKDDLKRQKRNAKEAKMAEEVAKSMGIDINAPLEEILNRGRKREEEFIKSLEMKYSRQIEDKRKKK